MSDEWKRILLATGWGILLYFACLKHANFTIIWASGGLFYNLGMLGEKDREAKLKRLHGKSE
jgi:hypothetical protein